VTTRNSISVILLACLVLMMAAQPVTGQTKSKISGFILNDAGEQVDLVNISIPGTPHGTSSNSKGFFQFSVPRTNEILIQFSRLGYLAKELTIKPEEYSNPDDIRLTITLEQMVSGMNEIVISADRDPGSNLIRIDPKSISSIPVVSGSFEDILKHLPGVSSSNELSSQYSVRGGNFDENLVYVNDIEIYRPFMIRSGQQEGLSFINSDMVSSVLFSSGGFDARYGDKLSSVLDIKYKKPTYFGASGSLSLMGGSLTVEGTSRNRRFSHISGIRYKSNRYLLRSLETTGDYNPQYTDFQTYLTYDLSTEWEISFLGNIANNVYEFVPKDRNTSWGTVNEALQLYIYFEGEEVDKFTTYMGAVTATYHPHSNLEMKWIASAFKTKEVETFDILGQYWLNELDKRMDSETYGDSLMNIGVGSFLDHARNKLDGQVMSFDWKGSWKQDNHWFNWGARYQQSFFRDRIEEWTMMDSAGYSLPYSDTDLFLHKTVFSESELSQGQFTAFLRDNWEIDAETGKVHITGGLRSTYIGLSKEFLLSPRASISFRPLWEKDLQFRLSAGAYHQPAFFKEFRDREGNINPKIKAQKSFHVVGGTDYFFIAWDRPFKFTTELYYKYLWDLIPYEVENVRIRYFGENNSHGYAAGIDTKIFGEFVPGIDSWASLSIMKTQEDIDGDTVGYIARPTDQRVNVGLYFQDYLPNNRSYQAHLSLLFGTGLPYGPPGSQEFKSFWRIPPYRRVDLGFSKVLVDKNNPSKQPFLKQFESIWLGLEVFNLLDINNTISHIWIRDISNRQFAIPNYLTGRRLNIRLQAKF